MTSHDTDGHVRCIISKLFPDTHIAVQSFPSLSKVLYLVDRL